MTRFRAMARSQAYDLIGGTLTILALLVPQAGSAQGSQDPPGLDPTLPTIRAERLIGEIHLDGLLTEDAWTRTEPANVFTQLDPWEGQPATEDTEITEKKRKLIATKTCPPSRPP